MILLRTTEDWANAEQREVLQGADAGALGGWFAAWGLGVRSYAAGGGDTGAGYRGPFWHYNLWTMLHVSNNPCWWIKCVTAQPRWALSLWSKLLAPTSSLWLCVLWTHQGVHRQEKAEGLRWCILRFPFVAAFSSSIGAWREPAAAFKH